MIYAWKRESEEVRERGKISSEVMSFKPVRGKDDEVQARQGDLKRKRSAAI